GVMIVGLRQKRDGMPLVRTLDLKEVVVRVGETASQAELNRAMRSISEARNALRDGCNGVDRVAGRGGLEARDLPAVNPADFDEPFRTTMLGLNEGQSSELVRSGGEISFLVACKVTVTGQDLPDRRTLEQRLFEQELGVIGRRYLRDLRREATIISR
nr:hypothetical protein [Hyphomonadaceae bacterium]